MRSVDFQAPSPSLSVAFHQGLTAPGLCNDSHKMDFYFVAPDSLRCTSVHVAGMVNLSQIISSCAVSTTYPKE